MSSSGPDVPGTHASKEDVASLEMLSLLSKRFEHLSFYFSCLLFFFFSDGPVKVHKCPLPGPIYTSQEDVASLERAPGSQKRTFGKETHAPIPMLPILQGYPPRCCWPENPGGVTS